MSTYSEYHSNCKSKLCYKSAERFIAVAIADYFKTKKLSSSLCANGEYFWIGRKRTFTAQALE